jgi:D-alanyl-lipoteichoic acid acyltransferase DltB (MBOAT superfamily)
MSYTSVSFIAFIACLFVAYYCVPPKVRWAVLLVASYVFYYFAAGAAAFVFILVTTVSIFYLAISIDGENTRCSIELADAATKEDKTLIKKRSAAKKRRAMLLGVILNIGMLAILKYSGFVVININDLIGANIGVPTLLLPLGISFYTFQTVGYLMDVYRGRYAADKNIFKFALFTSFFPQIIQGPISRHNQLAHQLYAPNTFDFTRVKHGLGLILWGFFKKLVIADRALILVNNALDHSDQYAGFQVAFACLIFMAQIYADFSGGIDISRGIAQVLGIDMIENFRRPHFSTSVSEYWRRWHITLGAWMRDYIFYPLTLSGMFGRLGKWCRKHIGKYWGKAIPACIGMGIVFLVVGIWHGAAWKFIIFGLYNGVFIMLETLFAGRLEEWNARTGFINTKAFTWKVFTILVTFTIIFFSKFFAMSRSAGQAIIMIKRMLLHFNPSILFNGAVYDMGLSKPSLAVLLLSIALFFIVSLMQENGIRVRHFIDSQNLVFRWALYFAAIFTVLIFGVYGPNVDAASFVYQQF